MEISSLPVLLTDRGALQERGGKTMLTIIQGLRSSPLGSCLFTTLCKSLNLMPTY